MNQNRPNRSESVRSPRSVTRLLHHEALRIDPDAVFEANLAAASAEQSPNLSQRDEEMAHSLHVVTVALASAEQAAMGAAVRQIGRLGLDLGMPDLRRVADDVLICLTSQDHTALAATGARLLRLGRQAQVHVQQLRPSS